MNVTPIPQADSVIFPFDMGVLKELSVTFEGKVLMNGYEIPDRRFRHVEGDYAKGVNTFKRMLKHPIYTGDSQQPIVTVTLCPDKRVFIRGYENEKHYEAKGAKTEWVWSVWPDGKQVKIYVKDMREPYRTIEA